MRGVWWGYYSLTAGGRSWVQIPEERGATVTLNLFVFPMLTWDSYPPPQNIKVKTLALPMSKALHLESGP